MLNADDVKHLSVDVNAIQTSVWSLLLNADEINGAAMPVEFFCFSPNNSDCVQVAATIGDSVEVVVIICVSVLVGDTEINCKNGLRFVEFISFANAIAAAKEPEPDENDVTLVFGTNNEHDEFHRLKRKRFVRSSSSDSSKISYNSLDLGAKQF